MGPGRLNIPENYCTIATSCLQSLRLYFHELNTTIWNGGIKKWTMYSTVRFDLSTYLCSTAWGRKVQWQRCHRLLFLLHVGPLKEERRPLVTILMCVNVGFSPPQKAILKHQLGFLQFNSTLTLSNWRYRLRAQSYKTSSLPPFQMPGYITCAPDLWAIN